MHFSRCTRPPEPARLATALLWGVSVIGLTWLVPPAADAQQGGLFSAARDGAAQPQSPASLDATPVRRRVVTLDLGRLRRAQVSAAGSSRAEARSKSVAPLVPRRATAPVSDASLPLNLFEDVVFTGIADWTEPTFASGYSLSGQLVEEPLGSLTLVVNDETVAGTVRKDLAELDGLRRLDLRGNSVRDLRPLRGLSSLLWVHVGGSRIEDMAPLDGLDGLTVAGRNDLEPPSPGNGRARRFASEGDAGR